MKANVAIRGALYQKALGQTYQKGQPTVLRADGSVDTEGVPDRSAIPGDFSAQKYWMFNRDPGGKWSEQKFERDFTPPDDDTGFKNKTSKELDEIIKDLENELINGQNGKSKNGKSEIPLIEKPAEKPTKQ